MPGELGLEVLQAVHGEVDPAIEQRLVDLLGEQALAADLGEAAVLHRVACGADRRAPRTHASRAAPGRTAEHGEERAGLGRG